MGRCRGVVRKIYLAKSCPDTDSPMKTDRGGPCINLSGAAGETSTRQPRRPSPCLPQRRGSASQRSCTARVSVAAAGAWHGAALSLAPLVPAPGWGGGHPSRSPVEDFGKEERSGGAGSRSPRREYLRWPPPRASCRAGLRRCRRGGARAAPGLRRGRGGGAGGQRGGGRQLQPRENNSNNNIGRFRRVSGRK